MNPLQELCLADALRHPVTWERTVRTEFPYIASVTWPECAVQTWTLRLNDFPDEPLYTLLVDGKPLGDFDDWPAQWQR
jgi:hypothetical protein